MKDSETWIRCPHCDERYSFDTEMETGWQEVKCEKCAKTIFVDTEVTVDAQAFAERQRWMKPE